MPEDSGFVQFLFCLGKETGTHSAIIAANLIDRVEM